jgi:hypothetical protein
LAYGCYKWKPTETIQGTINHGNKKRKWKWIGHTLRRDQSATERQALDWNLQGKWRWRRPRRTWQRCVEEVRKARETCREVKSLAGNRIHWRCFVEALCSRTSKRNWMNEWIGFTSVTCIIKILWFITYTSDYQSVVYRPMSGVGGGSLVMRCSLIYYWSDSWPDIGKLVLLHRAHASHYDVVIKCSVLLFTLVGVRIAFLKNAFNGVRQGALGMSLWSHEAVAQKGLGTTCQFL